MDIFLDFDWTPFEDGTFVRSIIGLALAAVFNLFLACIYKVMNRDNKESYIMMQCMIFIAVILAGAMMVIGNNLAVAFGLVGAVSIVRFRLNVNNLMDMSFIFLSIVVGMACGLGFYFIATVITVFIGLLMLCVYFLHLGNRHNVKEDEMDVTVSYDCKTVLSLEFRKEFLAIVKSFLNKKITLIEYKDKKDQIEILFRIPDTDFVEIQLLGQMLREKFPEGKVDIKAGKKDS